MTDGNASAVLDVFTSFFENIRRQRAVDNIALYSGDPDCCLIGSDKGEETYGMSDLATFFKGIDARPSGFDFQWDSVHCVVHGETAWVFAKGAVSGGGLAAGLPYLLTCIFVRRNGSWLVRHFHGSEPR